VETGSLRPGAIPEHGCPFGGPLWQLWVNHTLAHVEASRRGAPRAMLAVCAPEANATLDAQTHLAALRGIVADPNELALIGVNHLIESIGQLVSDKASQQWYHCLKERYGDI
jgi:hypothetical protein